MHKSAFFVCCLILLLLAGCQSGDTPAPTEPVITPGQVTALAASPTLTPQLPERIVAPTRPPASLTPSTTPSAIPQPGAAAPSATPTTDAGQPATPTPDLRLLPEDWQDWPVAPTAISDRLRQLYFQGLASGNNPQTFSKIGDCQNVPAAFLGFYDRPGDYDLDDYQELQITIDYFAGSFGRESQAVRGGFNVASVLSSLRSDLQVCQRGEIPLECEFRIWKPSIVFISMETWFQGRTAETYEKYLRQIIEFSLAHNVVPILATKADNTEGDHSINLTIARLAYEYDLPLWNFWLAVQPLPDHGIDWERDSTGFHITVDGWTRRSFTALQALDAVWKMLNAGDIPETPLTPTATAQPSATAVPPVFTPPAVQPATPTPEGFSQLPVRLLLSLGLSADNIAQESGILFIQPENEPAVQALTMPGYRLVALSPDGKNVLASQGTALFVAALDGSTTALLSDHLYSPAHTGAYWLPGSDQIIYLANPQTGTAIFLAQADGSAPTRLTADGADPVNLYPSPDASRVYWESASTGLHWSGIKSGEQGELPGVLRPAFSPGGQWVYTAQDSSGANSLYLAPAGGTDQGKALRTTKDGYFESYGWSPDGNALYLVETYQSGYSGRVLERQYFLFTAQGLKRRQVVMQESVASVGVWSPDSQSLALIGLAPTDDGYALNIELLNVITGKILSHHTQHNPWGSMLPYLGQIAWLP